MTPSAGSPAAVLYVGTADASEVVARLGAASADVSISVESDPDAAVSRLDAHECVLAEHAPPAVDGLALLRRAREAGSEVPFLFLAGGAVLTPEDATGYGLTDGGVGEDGLAAGIRRAIDRDERHSDGGEDSSRPTAELHRVINQAIARAHSREEIEQAVCERLAASDAGRLVWIGGMDENDVILPRASAGEADGYLEAVQSHDDWSHVGTGPVGRAIRTQDLQYVADIETDPVFEPWREPALARDIHSVAVIPLLYESRLQGALIIYSDEVDPFGPDERALLSELGTTVAHALEAIEARTEAHRFEQAVEHAGHAIYFGNTDGTIEYVNPAFEEITGYTSEEAVGRNPSFLHVEGREEPRVEGLWAALERGESWSEEIYERRASGEVYLAQQTIAPIGRRGTDGYVVVQTDITNRRLREQRLSVMNRVLRHNLRNDANVVLGGVANAIEASGDPVVQDALAPVDDAAGRLISMADRARHVDQVLEWVHSSDRHADDVRAIVERVHGSAAERAPKATILVEDVPAEVTLVDTSTELAIEELVGNAIEHADSADPRVVIRVARSGDGEVTVSVSDDGPGIPENERETLEQGYETQLTHGVGLGLWFVYWIVTSVGGSIDIDDADEDGSLVTVTIPIVDDTDG